MIEHHLPMVDTENHAFFCQDCGEVWARVRTVGARIWQCHSQYCPLHTDRSVLGNWEMASGSLLPVLVRRVPELCVMYDYEKALTRLLERLSPDHLKYEFTTTLEWAEKEVLKCQTKQVNSLV